MESLLWFVCNVPHPLPQLNGTQVESVQLKVSIARKQPMLDAATGKSVWGSLGKNEILPHPVPHRSPLLVPLRVLGSLEVWVWEALGMGRRVVRPSVRRKKRKWLKITNWSRVRFMRKMSISWPCSF